jgi:hypothetical protein
MAYYNISHSRNAPYFAIVTRPSASNGPSSSNADHSSESLPFEVESGDGYRISRRRNSAL